jgi:hypothetical protein
MQNKLHNNQRVIGGRQTMAKTDKPRVSGRSVTTENAANGRLHISPRVGEMEKIRIGLLKHNKKHD